MEGCYSLDTEPRSCRRLLDMLYGWAEFAGTDEFAQNELDTILDLYNRSFDCETDDDVRKFVEQRIVPLLIRG